MRLLSVVWGDADLAFILDPVDGTSNFEWGLPLFGVLCAVMIKGEAVAGMIYDPVVQELVCGVEEEAVLERFLQMGERAACEHCLLHRFAPEMLRVSHPWYLMDEPLRSQVAVRLARTRGAFIYRCAAYEYRLISEGHCHYALHSKLMPWDHAAGLLIHQEAGGYAAHFDGTPYVATNINGGIIAAPDRASLGTAA